MGMGTGMRGKDLQKFLMVAPGAIPSGSWG